MYRDDNLSEAHTSLAAIRQIYEWDWAAAEREFKEAIRLNPNYLTAHRWYAFHLSTMGQHEKAIEEINNALALDPQSYSLLKDAAIIYLMAQNYQKAAELCKSSIKINQTLPEPFAILSRIYAQENHFPEAFSVLEKAISINPKVSYIIQRAYLLAKSGQKQRAKTEIQILRRTLPKETSLYEFAKVYVALGNHEEAFELLEKEVSLHSQAVLRLATDLAFLELQSTYKFHQICERLGLPSKS